MKKTLGIALFTLAVVGLYGLISAPSASAQTTTLTDAEKQEISQGLATLSVQLQILQAQIATNEAQLAALDPKLEELKVQLRTIDHCLIRGIGMPGDMPDLPLAVSLIPSVGQEINKVQAQANVHFQIRQVQSKVLVVESQIVQTWVNKLK